MGNNAATAMQAAIKTIETIVAPAPRKNFAALLLPENLLEAVDLAYVQILGSVPID